MGIKKKIVKGLAPAALGISLLAGGTYAYFSDSAEANGTFAAGTLDLAVNPETIIQVDNMKPGDWMSRVFYLENNGSLDIPEVILNSSYEVVDANGDNTDDFGKHIRVNFLENADKTGRAEYNDIIFSTTLYDLKNMAPDAVEKKIDDYFGEGSGLDAGTDDEMYVQFEFVDNGEDQNQFQGDSLTLTWEFVGNQGEGEHVE
ncbi:cell division protein FtsN [Jeotgalibacillus sp. S-D1]|uniref:TasA family protein n=1 Tax=Jeotgalibacillus sp. S-D1 TaxID=2552189 RepID=UPI00105A2909|nr:TasA family protein [Jeotgalibacillus sp. S-D1]TDL30840.1 cell division protein FtsN [Jeotgalibacillus sp. S-D1]